MSQTDSLRATALLKRHNPVAPAGLVSDDDLNAARVKIQRLIADATTTAVTDGSPQRRGDQAQRVPGRGRLVARLAAAGLVVAAGAAGVVVTTSTGPATQSASAQTISSALRALQAPRGSILHFDFTCISLSKGHRYNTFREDVWSELDSPWQQLVVDQHLRGKPAGTAQTNNELYDPSTNTLYEPPLPDHPGWVYLPAAERAKMSPSQLKHARTIIRAENRSLRGHPWMTGYIDGLKAKLASGRAHVDGRAAVDGHQTVKITFRGSSEVDFVDAGTYTPVKLITQPLRSDPTYTSIHIFHTFEYLHAATHAAVFNLAAAHPTAKIDTSLHDYGKAQDR